MLKNIFTWIFIFPLVILLIVFSLLNTDVTPVGIGVEHTIDIPIFAVFWAGLLIGLLVGLVSTWMGGHGLRQKVATLESENKAYRGRLDDAQDEQTKLKARMFDVAEEQTQEKQDNQENADK